MGFSTWLQGKKLFFIGIKGTGMATLACLVKQFGAKVHGSDSPEVFATDTLLAKAGIEWRSLDESTALPTDTDIVVYSTAYSKDKHPQLIEAVRRRLPLYTYPEMLARISQSSTCYGVAGTHGKTTVVGCTADILRPTGLPCFSLFGASIQGGEPYSAKGDSIGILESCEYQEHFLLYTLHGLLVTNIEHDHPDCFPTEESVYLAFQQLVGQLPLEAFLICGSDSPLSWRLASWARQAYPGKPVFTYGERPGSDFLLHDYHWSGHESLYQLDPLEGEFNTVLAGKALCLDVIGAGLLGACIVHKTAGTLDCDILFTDAVLPALLNQTSSFPGCSGRLEMLEEAKGVLFMDDYAHHPSQIEATLESVRSRFPSRRIVVVFSPHTLSRTSTFFEAFARTLSGADVLIVQSLYASARQDGEVYANGLSISEKLAHAAHGRYAADDSQVQDILAEVLHEGDLCITMGAGNNRGLSTILATHRRSATC